jgi:hypothetical protein
LAANTLPVDFSLHLYTVPKRPLDDKDGNQKVWY